MKMMTMMKTLLRSIVTRVIPRSYLLVLMMWILIMRMVNPVLKNTSSASPPISSEMQLKMKNRSSNSKILKTPLLISIKTFPPTKTKTTKKRSSQCQPKKVKVRREKDHPRKRRRVVRRRLVRKRRVRKSKNTPKKKKSLSLPKKKKQMKTSKSKK